MCCSPNKLPYHSNREVIVDDAVGDRVALLLLVIGDDVYVPAVQHHLCAVLDVTEELQQAATLVTCPEGKHRIKITIVERPLYAQRGCLPSVGRNSRSEILLWPSSKMDLTVSIVKALYVIESPSTSGLCSLHQQVLKVCHGMGRNQPQ